MAELVTIPIANWEAADEIIKILKSGLEVLVQIGKVKISSFKTAVALHLQPIEIVF